jgi:hypothetical protein
MGSINPSFIRRKTFPWRKRSRGLSRVGSRWQRRHIEAAVVVVTAQPLAVEALLRCLKRKDANQVRSQPLPVLDGVETT